MTCAIIAHKNRIRHVIYRTPPRPNGGCFIGTKNTITQTRVHSSRVRTTRLPTVCVAATTRCQYKMVWVPTASRPYWGDPPPWTYPPSYIPPGHTTSMKWVLYQGYPKKGSGTRDTHPPSLTRHTPVKT